MKIAVFKFNASIARWKDKGGGECIDTFVIEDEINSFCKGKQIVDIKVNTVDYDYHNNGGCNGITLVYTVLYND